LFFILMFGTAFWIRKSYLSHFHPSHLPPIIKEKKWAIPTMLVVSFFVGIIGSSIVKAIGWEPTLKLLNYVSFHKTDPYFGMDVSFYIFVLPFIKFILYTLLNALVFFLVLQAGAYYAFNIYRMNRTAQIHMAVTILAIGILIAATHFIGKYNTLLTDYVNYFQKSVVHGLSYTDHLINIPKAHILSVIVLLA